MNDKQSTMKQIIHAIIIGIKGYFLSLIKLSLVTLVIVAIGLYALGIDYWFFIAIGIAVVDLLPILGSGMVFVPWAIIELIRGNQTIAWQLGLLFVVLVLIRQILEPIFTGKSIGVRPIYTFIVTVFCVILFGPFGAIIGSIVAIVLKAIFSVQLYQKQPTPKE